MKTRLTCGRVRERVPASAIAQVVFAITFRGDAMQFQAFDPDVEVNGQTVLAVVAGMKSATWVAERMLAAEGIVDPQPNEWYGQQAWLNAFKAISERVGGLTLRKIGNSIPENADWPPDVSDVPGALASIDVAYHLNHRLHGHVLMNLETGSMSEGIGHYGFAAIDDHAASMTCRNPYPCDFDRGIIEAAALKFRPVGSNLKVDHAAGDCRKKGAESCTYEVHW
jgi:hypothetical protein